MHKSNSTYFTDVDVARTHLICTLFARGIENVRGGTSSLVHGKPSNFGVALGAVSCSFRKELKPFEKYDLHTRVLTWDQKWIYIVTYFVKKGAILPSHFLLYPEQGGSMPRRKVSPDPDKVIAASALSKLVFKKGRVTISPEIMLEASGLLPEKVLKTSFFKDPDAVNTPQNATSETEPIIALPTQVTSTLPARRDIDEISPTSSRTNSMASLFSSNSSNGENESGTESQTSLDDSEEDVRAPPNTTAKGHQTQSQLSKWTRSRIEMERQRGMAMANHLAAQADLANGFDPTAPALGYHSDGTGLPGIISTLAQLGKLTRKSSL
ncbi:putative capsule polysaccharide biosynthesis protein [Phaeomoniella chlamydospora]|uniref:Putative capsule polysaccharide biosynthesis protein n=1 Tax=Phaeomoniella chlamydospora TaxID=158046 RepID=A0A0G2DVE2_PHACM|nr:putative capsule polysaccharide biosynthesis protein [Phaeomoniella chlamydospora]